MLGTLWKIKKMKLWCNQHHETDYCTGRFQMQALFSFILKLVGMEGFEPTQPVAPDLQSGPIRRHRSIPM